MGWEPCSLPSSEDGESPTPAKLAQKPGVNPCPACGGASRRWVGTSWGGRYCHHLERVELIAKLVYSGKEASSSTMLKGR